MAYQAKRLKKVIEEFELVDENGIVVEQLHVELDAGKMAEKINGKYIALIRAQADATKIHAGINSNEEVQNGYVRLGVAVTDMIEAVFGAEDTAKILAFYEKDYIVMTREVIPFISSIVIPKLRDVAQQNKRQVLSQYNRKQRRSFLKKVK